jgi:cytochrome P450/NADPH-cytochrome P450 reductase
MNAPLSLHDIPSPRGLPWLGNLLQIPKGRLTQHLLEISRDFDGILALDFAGLRLPFVYDAELVAELSDPKRFRKTIGPPLSTLRKLAADGLFTADGEEPNWGKAHRILMPAFGQRAMKGYFPYMLEVAEQLAQKWARLGPDADVEVADDMTRLTLDTISLAGFGFRFDSFARDELHPFLGAMGAVLEEVMTRITRSKLQNQLMRAGLERMELDIATMHALVDEVIRARRASDAPRAQRDLLDLMLQARDPVTDEPLDDANIRAQVITFLIAGHETTSGLLTFALYQLMRHPETLARCYAEVDRVLPAGTTPAFEHIARLETLERVLRETLRLWPTAPSYAVGAIDETLLGGRWRLAAGQRVLVFLPGLHRNPRWWDRPEAFDIDRFAPGARERIHPHAYKPFGNGERACIGQQFAITEAKLALAVILQRFALSDPSDYRLAVRETLTLKPDGLRLRVSPRRQPAPAAPGNPAGTPPAHAPAAMPAASPRAPTVADGSASPTAPVAGAAIATISPEEAAAAATLPFEIRYGSSVGVCAEVAGQVAEVAREAGFEPRVIGLDEAPGGWPATGWLVVITATYNGRAPDNARRLEAALDEGTTAAWRAPELRYAMLGCGNSQWPAYQAFPKRVADALAGSGARAFLARGQADGNGDFDGAVDGWLAGLRQALAPCAAIRARDAQAGQVAAAAGRAGPLSVVLADATRVRERAMPAGAVAMTVLEALELTKPAAGLWDFAREAPRASTRMLRLAVPEGLSYATGDHLAVWGRNAPAEVARIAHRLGLDADTVVTLHGDDAVARALPRDEAMTVGQLLGEFVEWQEPAVRRDIERLHAATRCPHTRERLGTWLGTGSDDASARARLAAEITAPRVSVADLLFAYPAIECTLADFLRCCSPMRPRWYSISSSALAHPRELTITVGALDARHVGGHGRYHGLASTHLCGLAEGDTVIARVRTPAPAFAPPADPSVPIVMVGPGTGIAPFRGFIEERAWRRARGEPTGPAWLFTGGRHPSHDDLHGEELAAWTAQGVLTRSAAWSSLEGHPWRFVQDALWAQREALWAWLAEGACFYLCGDGKAMAPAVRDTLRRIALERLGNEAQAAAWLAELASTGRLREDVFN